MNKTILITGTSTGFGASAVHYFAQKGWNVIATMRDITKAGDLQNMDRVFVTKLDVQDKSSIETAITGGIERFGNIDVVVNNAGYGLFGIFESISPEGIQDQFAVNVFGAMDVVRAILPHFRAKNNGTIINISSGAGAIGFPMASVYSASKFALEGWSEGLRYELASLGIKVKIVEPGGATKTAFIERMGGESAGLQAIENYIPFLEQIGKVYGGMATAADADAVEKVVTAIYDAATDNTDTLRYAPTNDIQALLKARRTTSEEAYQQFTSGVFAPAAESVSH
ncbi:SDR family oxidoreductase [Chitinophaga pinensis]|uniref:Short-chain dehydrogenase/reductase SDR n=1 Tax=Chitinophaga pinensis (strain ATCC 43595 / DSM 2588 / LMG 13176 / NBRC 15968 / NCIMB 11800 / UQM 2034) TaxID=485918 RepID=A0A979GU78_CHIPD|nr:SDR family oxidoreductase [Chitinophaga pinensis]ACU60604.1 short-chain dehydrogenase/reductase SDR [Chitinophaga pinensis DSM 2588]